MTTNEIIDYEKLFNPIKFQLIKKILEVLSSNKFTPNLEILFFTGFNGVIVPDYLKKLYPDQMLIILQHQFYNLKVSEDKFSVSLSFSGKQEQITVPFFAISEFHDKVSGDILTLDKFGVDSNEKYQSKECNNEYAEKPPDGAIISIDFRNK
ncbi:MAG: ClpXP protease specificity-enhancing factor SspB [Wolbachia sp.]|nr:ClpXP protease specificity-enhancing factor SspB [Wolbachia sp.]MDD9336608.1 ClpXP protease specificity-enhancing factor SspB [Wolbachia sp.]